MQGERQSMGMKTESELALVDELQKAKGSHGGQDEEQGEKESG